jgi:putative transposase
MDHHLRNWPLHGNSGQSPACHVQRFVSIHDPIANLFHFLHNRITASEHRAARSQAFETWTEIAGTRLAA